MPEGRDWEEVDVAVIYEKLQHLREAVEDLPEAFPNRTKIMQHEEAIRRLLPTLEDNPFLPDSE